MRTLPFVVATLLLLPGCFSKDTATGAEDDRIGSTSGGSPTTGGTTTPPPKPRDPNTRWHYHNYWGVSTDLPLLDANITLPLVSERSIRLQPRTPPVEFRLPHGVIVPPETGEVNVSVQFTPFAGVPATGLNFSYIPGGGTNWTSVRVANGAPLTLPVTYDQTDVPHRGSSAWRFRLEAASDAGPALANGTAHVQITARIGRPLLIDPPHIDHWRGRTILPLATVTANLTLLKLAEDRYAHGSTAGADVLPYAMEVPLPNGSIVPERAREVVVHVYWNDTGFAKPSLVYSELNRPSNGTLQPNEEAEGHRVYRIPIAVGMSDSPYANQSTWRFTVLLEGTPGTSFQGAVTLVAMAERRPA